MADATLGRFVWHELLTTDTKSAAEFYGTVVGWKTQAWGDDGLYTLFTKAGRPLAGLMLLPEEAKQMGAPPNWLMYVGTPRVDDTAKKAVSLGAKVIKAPTDIPNAGRIAVLQDPQGAVFGIYQANPSASGDAGADGMGDFSWHELSTTDWKAALTFYQTLFGWRPTSAMDMGGIGTYQMYGLDGRTLGGMMNKPKEQPGPPAWLSYIRVPDAKKAVPVVSKLGGTVIHGPMEVPGGDFIAVGVDLQGAVFAVHSVTAQAAAKPAAAPAKTPKAVAPKAVAKTAVAPKVVAKKAVAKKAAPKAGTKKAGTKKAGTKKAGTKKAGAKKAGTKKAAARKAVTKKAVAKKTAPKKAAGKAAKRAVKRPVKKSSTRKR